MLLGMPIGTLSKKNSCKKMESILNITNGDSAVNLMREAAIPGVFLPWQDVLHDGPVPSGLSLQELSQIRAQFIIDRNWGDPDQIKFSFTQRDETLYACRNYDRVILWFEHDLYDQLQIVQILDWFAENPLESNRLSMICTEQYLGMCTPEQIAALTEHETSVTQQQLVLAKRAWKAFRSSNPEDWQALLRIDTNALPFLEGAVLRQLQEYPHCKTGLSLSAQRALQIIAQGEGRPGRVFGIYQEQEERKFMGDASFWVILQELLATHPPLLKLPEGLRLTLPSSPDQRLMITPEGEAMLTGKRNWLDQAKVDCWIGGVHLTPDHLWCWDAENERLCRVG